MQKGSQAVVEEVLTFRTKVKVILHSETTLLQARQDFTQVGLQQNVCKY